jgi:hypothetical protein
LEGMDAMLSTNRFVDARVVSVAGRVNRLVEGVSCEKLLTTSR